MAAVKRMGGSDVWYLAFARVRAIARRVRRSMTRRGVGGTILYVVYGRSRAARLTDGARWDPPDGIDVGGRVGISELTIDSARRGQGHGYQASRPDVLRELLGSLNVDHGRLTFIDVGSGKGLALLIASEFPFREIIGIEFAREMHEVAVQNIQAYHHPAQRCHAIRSVLIDAMEFSLPTVPTVFYVNNPFEGRLIRQFAMRVAHSYRARPRDIYFIHGNPLTRRGLHGVPLFTSICERRARWNERLDVEYVIYRVGGERETVEGTRHGLTASPPTAPPVCGRHASGVADEPRHRWANATRGEART